MKVILKKSILIFFLFSSTSLFAKQKNWNYSLELEITRCFKRENVKVWCEDFSFLEKKKTVLNQELLIEAIDYYNKKRSYGYGKAITGALCKNQLSKITLLLKNSDQVCITGDDERAIGSNETFSRWRGLETKSGEINW